MKKNKSLILVLSIIMIVSLVSISLSLFFFFKYREVAKILNNPSLTAQEEAKNLRMTVGKLMIIPDEVPLVVTVMDKDKLKDQPFFAKATNGDKILVFQDARLAILYNPRENKIVQVGPFNPPQTSPSPASPPTGEEQGNFNLNNTEDGLPEQISTTPSSTISGNTNLKLSVTP